VEADGRVQGRNGHNTLADVVRGKARLLIVEKPGVKYLDNPPDPGGASRGSPEFHKEHTLERWVEAVHAAIVACRKLPKIRADRLLVAGHSEGGIVAAKLAGDYDRISHVAVLAGGGPTQLYDLLTLAKEGEFFRRVSDDPQQRVQHVLNEWNKIQADPDNADKLFFGHPYRRWSSFLKTSTLEQLLRAEAKIYVAQGTADRAVAWESFELLRAGLLSRGKNVQFDAVEGADHSFAIRTQDPPADGWQKTWERIIDWYVGD
jgi:dipeptidyl aminopeptidase/acylaminoacyl peptidase